jgi:hypothetical protein
MRQFPLISTRYVENEWLNIHVYSYNECCCDLVKVPLLCKLMIPVGTKPKRGWIPNALKGLKNYLLKAAFQLMDRKLKFLYFLVYAD